MTLSQDQIIKIAKHVSNVTFVETVRCIQDAQAAAKSEKRPETETIDVLDTPPQEHVEIPEIPETPTAPPRILVTMSFNGRGYCTPDELLRLMDASDRVAPLFFVEEPDIRHTAHATRPWIPTDPTERSALISANAGSLNVADWWRWFNPLSVRAKWYFRRLKEELGTHFNFTEPIDICLDVEEFYKSMYNARLRDQSIESDTREMEASDHAAEHLEEMEALAHDVREAAHAEGIAIDNIYWYGCMRAAANNPTRVDPWTIISSSSLYHPTQAIYPRAEWEDADAMRARIAYLQAHTNWGKRPIRYFLDPRDTMRLDDGDRWLTEGYALAMNATKPVEMIVWGNGRRPGNGMGWQVPAVEAILEATA